VFGSGIRLAQQASGRRRPLPMFAAIVVSALLFAPAAEARETCPGDVLPEANPYRLYFQHAISRTCPCGDPADPAAFRRCAKDLSANLVDVGVLPTECQEKAIREIRRSTCGRPGSVVCCTVKPNGSHPHRVLGRAGKCRSGPAASRCISPFSSVAAGCDADGCAAPTCGNEVLEVDETCDPPWRLLCDDECHTIPCIDIPSSCGNLTIDDGETCEPPGVGSCARDCRSAACSPARAGETALACVDGPSTVDAAASAAEYLVVWDGKHRRPSEILARRLDADGIAGEAPAIEVSAGEPCGTFRSDPAVGTDGVAWYVLWTAWGVSSVGYAHEESYKAIHGRRLAFAGGDSEIHEFDRVSRDSNDTCFVTLDGPNVARSSRMAGAWVNSSTCSNSTCFIETRSPSGGELSFEAGQTALFPALGGSEGRSGCVTTPRHFPAGAAGLDASADGTLWAWHNEFQADDGAPLRYFVAARWSDGALLSPIFELTGRNALIAGTSPTVASGSTSSLVAWAQGANDAATVATEIRAVRVTRADGRLDPDGGVLLATAPGGILTRPDAVFDGVRWLVAWVEATPSGNELRAVAVDTDGSGADTAPRLLAGEVAAAPPSLASRGDGRALVAFTRADGTLTAVRSILVEP
jgi:hypothetical protein